MSPLAELLKTLRLAHRRSQTEFGALIAIAGSHVCIIEKGLRYAPEIKSLEPLIGALDLSRDEQLSLRALAEVSPRKLRIPPNSPAAAFRLIASLEKQWPELTEAEFNQLQHLTQSFHRNSVDYESHANGVAAEPHHTKSKGIDMT